MLEFHAEYTRLDRSEEKAVLAYNVKLIRRWRNIWNLNTKHLSSASVSLYDFKALYEYCIIIIIIIF